MMDAIKAVKTVDSMAQTKAAMKAVYLEVKLVDSTVVLMAGYLAV